MSKYLIASATALSAASAAIIPGEPLWKVSGENNDSNDNSEQAPMDLEFCWGNGDLIMLHSNYISSTGDFKISVNYPQLFKDSHLPNLGRNYGAEFPDTVKLFSPSGDSTGFGWDLSCVGDQVTGRTLFVARNMELEQGAFTNQYDPDVFVYKGSWSHWTATQMLTSSDESPNNEGFGNAVAADKFHQRTVVVGCDTCLDSDDNEAGKLYVYDATSPSAQSWSEVQVLALDIDFASDSTVRSSAYPANAGDCNVVNHEGGGPDDQCGPYIFACPDDQICISSSGFSGGSDSLSSTLVTNQLGNTVISSVAALSNCYTVPSSFQCMYYTFTFNTNGFDNLLNNDDFASGTLSTTITFDNEVQHTDFNLGSTVNIYDDTIVAGGWESHFRPSYFVYFRRPDGQWSYQQQIKWGSLGSEAMSNYERDQISLFNDILVIGTPFEHTTTFTSRTISGAFSNFQLSGSSPGAEAWEGKVHILQSAKAVHLGPRDDAKPAPPRPDILHFSHQQILESPSDVIGLGPVEWGYFGSAVAVDANSLLVVEANGQVQNNGGGNIDTEVIVWVYKRKPNSALWSAQQALFSGTHDGIRGTNLSPLNFYNVFSGMYGISFDDLSGSANPQAAFRRPMAQLYGGIGGVGVMGAGSGFRIAIINETSKWNCLVISVGDHFGDGWDTAVLEVTAPDGRIDQFAPNCGRIHDSDDDADDGNQGKEIPYLEFEYCPTNIFDEGVYSLSVANAASARFKWEIEWWVKLHSEISVFPGKLYRGKHDTEMKFSWSAKDKTFTPLPPPEQKNLIVNQTKCDECATSPPPHLGYIFSDDVRWFTLSDISTGAKGWWHAYKQLSTRYYVSDLEGRTLIESKQFCKRTDLASNTICFLDIPDGDYIFRLGGALDGTRYNSNSYRATLGSVSLFMGYQSTFNLKDSVLVVNGAISASTLCAAYDVIVHGLGEMKLNGLIVESLGDLSEDDVDTLVHLVESAFSGMSAVRVRLVSLRNTVLSFKVDIPLATHGVEENFDNSLLMWNNVGQEYLSLSSSTLSAALSFSSNSKLTEITSITALSFYATTVTSSFSYPQNLVENSASSSLNVDPSNEYVVPSSTRMALTTYIRSEEVIVLVAVVIVLFVSTRWYKTERVFEYSKQEGIESM